MGVGGEAVIKLSVGSLWVLLAACSSPQIASSPTASTSSVWSDRRAPNEVAVQEARRESAALRSELAAARIQMARQEAELVNLRQTEAEARRSTDGLGRDAEGLRRELDALKTERAQLLKRAQELEAQVATIPVLKQQAETARAAESSLQSRMAALTGTVETLTKNLEQVKSELAAVHDTVTAQGEQVGQLQRTAAASRPKGPESIARVPVTGKPPAPATGDRAMLPVVETVQGGLPVLQLTVEPGASLWMIAQRYHVTVQRLKNLNGLTSDRLVPGQVLLIPVTGESRPPSF